MHYFSLHVEVWVCISSESEDEKESVEGHHGGMAKNSRERKMNSLELL